MSDTRRLILHCGPPKTGSSAIQACLRDNPPPGIAYPSTGQWPDGAHHFVSYALAGLTRRGNIDIPTWDSLAPALIAEMDEADDTVVLSSEAFDLAKVNELLGRILPALSRPFDHIELVLCLRHPLERLASAYNQGVKDPVISEKRLPDDYLARSVAQFCLTPFVSQWAKCPYPVSFLNYHPASTMLPRFLAKIGYPDASIPNASLRRNPSMSGIALAALLTAHRIGMSPAKRAALFERLRKDPATKMWNSPSYPFSARASQQVIETTISKDLSRLQTQIGLDLSKDYDGAPDRITLDFEQQNVVREKLAPCELTPDQQRELNAVLDLFTAQVA